jgi:hypothetical protein
MTWLVMALNTIADPEGDPTLSALLCNYNLVLHNLCELVHRNGMSRKSRDRRSFSMRHKFTTRISLQCSIAIPRIDWPRVRVRVRT